MRSTLPFALLGVAVPCLAQDLSERPANHFSASARLLFNATAQFRTTGMTASSADPGPPTGHGLAREYDDGYVRLDADGNAGGLTWNWGYRDPSQVPGDDTLRFHAATGTAEETSSASLDEPAPGFELAWRRDWVTHSRWIFGSKLGFGWNDMTFEDSSTLSSMSSVLTDVYSLGGVHPPTSAPGSDWQYQGIAEVPGPLIPDEPLRREQGLASGSAQTTGTRRLEASLWAWKLGPWAEVDLCEWSSIVLGGGLAVGWMDATYSWDEQSSVAGLPTQVRRGTEDGSEVLVGGYLEAALTIRMCRSARFVVGAEYQGLQSFEQTFGNRNASVDLGATWALQTGFQVSF
jgi:hypothetical protein